MIYESYIDEGYHCVIWGPEDEESLEPWVSFVLGESGMWWGRVDIPTEEEDLPANWTPA